MQVPEGQKVVKCDRGTQRPSVPDIANKKQCERGQRELRAEVIDTVKEAALKCVHFVQSDMPEFVSDVTSSKKWQLTFGVSNSSWIAKTTTSSENPILQSLVK